MAQAVAPLPPGPKTPAVWQLLRYSHSPLPFLEACGRCYGDPFTIRFAGSVSPSRSNAYRTPSSPCP